MSDRFFCPGPALREGGPITLEGNEARHLARVRRVPEGAVVALFDGSGVSVTARVLAIGKSSVSLQPEAPLEEEPPPTLALTLASALPKGERIDWLIEKATELGVARFVPLRTERSSVEPRASKLDRLRGTVIEACKQCGRNRLMEIEPVTSWAEWLASPARTDHAFLAHPGGPPFERWGRHAIPATALVAIGPEGGFTDREVAQGRDAGFGVLGLGSFRLRIETAALAACAQFLAFADLR